MGGAVEGEKILHVTQKNQYFAIVAQEIKKDFGLYFMDATDSDDANQRYERVSLQFKDFADLFLTLHFRTMLEVAPDITVTYQMP